MPVLSFLRLKQWLLFIYLTLLRETLLFSDDEVHTINADALNQIPTEEEYMALSKTD